MHFSLSCPNCGAEDYYKTDTRSISEKIRQAIFHQRPYHCNICSFRGWISFEIYNPAFSRQQTTLCFVVVFVSILLGIIAGATIN